MKERFEKLFVSQMRAVAHSLFDVLAVSLFSIGALGFGFMKFGKLLVKVSNSIVDGVDRHLAALCGAFQVERPVFVWAHRVRPRSKWFLHFFATP